MNIFIFIFYYIVLIKFKCDMQKLLLELFQMLFLLFLNGFGHLNPNQKLKYQVEILLVEKSIINNKKNC